MTRKAKRLVVKRTQNTVMVLVISQYQRNSDAGIDQSVGFESRPTNVGPRHAAELTEIHPKLSSDVGDPCGIRAVRLLSRNMRDLSPWFPELVWAASAPVRRYPKAAFAVRL
jgi:hypothetical protein